MNYDKTHNMNKHTLNCFRHNTLFYGFALNMKMERAVKMAGLRGHSEVLGFWHPLQGEPTQCFSCEEGRRWNLFTRSLGY